MTKPSANAKDQAKRRDNERRWAAPTISSLMLCPDAKLAGLRHNLGVAATIDMVQLRKARDIIEALAHTLSSADDDRWQWVEDCWESLQGSSQQPAAAKPAQSATARVPSSAPAASQVGDAPPAGTGALPSLPKPAQSTSPWAGHTAEPLPAAPPIPATRPTSDPDISRLP